MTTMYQVFANSEFIIELADESDKQDGTKLSLHLTALQDNAVYHGDGTACTSGALTLADVALLSENVGQLVLRIAPVLVEVPTLPTWQDIAIALGVDEIADTNLFDPLEGAPERWEATLPGIPIKCLYNETETVTAYVGLRRGLGVTVVGYHDYAGNYIGH